MANKAGKKYEAARKQVEAKEYQLEEAIPLLKKIKFAKFDETVEVHMRLGVDPKHADQMVRVLGVHPETHVYFHGLVEFGEFDFLEKRNGLFELILFGLYLLQRGLILFTWFACHVSSLVQAVRRTNKRTSH